MLFPIKVGRQVVPLSGDYYVNDDGFRSSLVVAGQLPVADIAPADSVAVLGEPGIGKSHAICELTSGDARVVDLELDTLTDASELRERLAAVDAAIREGVAPDRITVVLDSLDECGLPRKALLRQLEASVRRHPHLRVVLGCRTADWSESFGTRLQALLPSLLLYELLPLGRADIIELAASRGVDGESFVSAVVEAAAVPLAVLPLTLDLLVGTCSQSGQLPGSAADLYEQGLLRLVEEPDPDRPSGKKPTGTPSQRLAVAAKLAVYMMLCGRSAIARGVLGSGDYLLAGALAGGSEPLGGGDFSVTAELIDATIATAAFTGRGSGRFDVVHASFGA